VNSIPAQNYQYQLVLAHAERGLRAVSSVPRSPQPSSGSLRTTRGEVRAA
jgi:hypothetical protein